MREIDEPWGADVRHHTPSGVKTSRCASRRHWPGTRGQVLDERGKIVRHAHLAELEPHLVGVGFQLELVAYKVARAAFA